MIAAQHYAQALYDTTAHTSPEVRDARVESFLALLKRKGHEKLLPSIVSHFERLAEVKREKEQAVLLLARLSHADDMKRRAFRYYAPADGAVTPVEDDRIVGGFVLKDGDVIVDGSYKRMLINLYRKLTV